MGIKLRLAAILCGVDVKWWQKGQLHLAERPPWTQGGQSLHDLECADDVDWHYVKTKLSNYLQQVTVQELVNTPLDSTLLGYANSRSNVAFEFTSLPSGAWGPLLHLFYLLRASGKFEDGHHGVCMLGYFAFTALNFALVQDDTRYVQVARVLHTQVFRVYGVLDLTLTGWPGWPLLHLVVSLARHRGIHLWGLPVIALALKDAGRDNRTKPASELIRIRRLGQDILMFMMKALSQIRISPKHGILEPWEERMLIIIDKVYVIIADLELEVALWFMGAMYAIWATLALLHRNRFIRGACPGQSLLISSTVKVGVPVFWLCARFDLHHPIDTHLLEAGFFPDCMEVIQSIGPPMTHGEDIVVDVGSNIGACAMSFAALGYRVRAFEPSPTEAAMLKASAMANQYAHFKVTDALVSNTSGQREVLYAHHGLVDVNQSKASPMWVGALVRPKKLPSLKEVGLAAVSSFSAQAVRLDEVLDLATSGISTLRLLKVDAEMHEEEVFQGARNVLLAAAQAARAAPALTETSTPGGASRLGLLVHFEYVPRHLEAMGLDPLGPPRLLMRLGYRVFDGDGEVRRSGLASFAQRFAGGNLQAWPDVRGRDAE